MSDSKAEPSQLNKFKELARELEVDEDEAAFEEAVKKVAISAPAKPPEKDGE
ncbi:hypothetical protein [Phenylobacterium sp.]|uniref:hypothetical protein n=1 Tax=Phenylobacterium sp. TaxID=1871053 RepID=UPI0035B0AA6E